MDAAGARHATCELALRKAATAFMSARMSRMYASYSKVHHSLTDNLHLFNVMRSGPIPVAAQSKGRYTLVTLPRNVTPYRDSVDGPCDHVTYQKLVTRLSYRLVRCAVGI